MSRSVKKHPIVKCGLKGAKKFAARRVRRYKGGQPVKSCFYKKLYLQYDVIDNIYVGMNIRQRLKLYRLICRKLRKNDLTSSEIEYLFERIQPKEYRYFTDNRFDYWAEAYWYIKK